MRSRLQNFLRRPTISETITFLTVFTCVVFTISQLQPSLLIMNSTTAGGDMGAHVWAPDFLKHHLLPHGRVTGWTPDWYDGFPALTFYFPLPAVLVVLLSFILPYGVAFKFVTVLGIVSLPVAAYLFGRLARLPFPVPACLAAATVPFLFDTGYTILGGNIASTLAGEFAFSIALSLALVFLGLVAGGMETSRRRWLAAVFFGLTLLCHILPSIFALVGGVLLVLMRVVTGGRTPIANPDDVDAPKRPGVVGVGLALLAVDAVVFLVGVVQFFSNNDGGSGSGLFMTSAVLTIVGLFLVFGMGRAVDAKPASNEEKPRVGARLAAIKWAIPVGVIGALLSAFWAVPFVLRSNYMNDMGWEKIGVGTESGMKLYDQKIIKYSDALFPDHLWGLLLLGFAGAAVALYLRRRIGIFFMLVAAVSAIGFIVMPQGRLWNARLLPFYYFALYMLAGLLVAEIGWALAAAMKRFRDGVEIARGLSYVTPVIAIAGALMFVVPHLPPPGWWPVDRTSPWHDPATNGASFIPGWATWNYSGYEGKKSDGTYYKPAHPEFAQLVSTMSDVGKQYGCGRAMWEYEPTLDRFGTPMALMLLPMQTKGCIGSMEGLFFESSATVPYHFLNQALLSATPSSAMRNLPYGSLDIGDGIGKLQLLGVKYYMAVTPKAQQQAAVDARLTLVATAPAAADEDGTERTWNVYEIADTDLVAPLEYVPNVLTSPQTVSQTLNGANKPPIKLNAREAWLENSVNWYEDPNKYTTPYAASGPADWPRIKNADQAAVQQRVESPAKVTYTAVGDDRISFDVDHPGAPVVVKASYFPNWKATGANGPYRISPNLMVVVPTSNHVELSYGRTGVDWLGILGTLLGVIGVVWLYRRDKATGPYPYPVESDIPAYSPPYVPLGMSRGDEPAFFDYPSQGPDPSRTTDSGPLFPSLAGPSDPTPPGTPTPTETPETPAPSDPEPTSS